MLMILRTSKTDEHNTYFEDKYPKGNCIFHFSNILENKTPWPT